MALKSRLSSARISGRVSSPSVRSATLRSSARMRRIAYTPDTTSARRQGANCGGRQALHGIGDLLDPVVDAAGSLSDHLNELVRQILTGFDGADRGLWQFGEAFADLLFQEPGPTQNGHQHIFQVMPDVSQDPRHFREPLFLR